MADDAQTSAEAAREGPAPAEEPTGAKLAARRLLVVGTGAVAVTFLPFWVNWLRINHPDVERRIVLTRSAERFVTRAALTSVGGTVVEQDRWTEEPTVSALHVDLAEWAEAVVVWPASFNFIARFATGLADTPVMLALQCTTAPIGIAPALPPGGERSVAFRNHLAALRERENVTLVPPHPGRSATTGRSDASVAAPFPVLVAELARLERAAAERT